MSVLVSGGAGYIGSHTSLALLEAGYEVIVADNLVNASKKAIDRVSDLAGKEVCFYEIDLCDAAATEQLFCENPTIDSVIHFAALKAVGESVQKPLEYYDNNLISTLNLLKSMRRHQVKNFVFSSSATVYGDPQTLPITEDMPLSAQSPYGSTKLIIETILRDVYKAQLDMNIAILRYFNPIGAHKSGKIGEDPNGIPNNLVPYIAKVAVGSLAKVQVYGNDYNTKDGTGVRDYLHVVDLANGHVAALAKLKSNPGLVTYNLGTGTGYSVLEVIAAFSKACGKQIPYEIVARRAGDVAAMYADATKAYEELHWRAMYTIDDMCEDTWRWQSNHPNGFK